jgi:chromosome partitioning protein
MLYAQHLLIPVSMDPLSLQGAAASITTARTLSNLFNLDIKVVAFLPVKVDRRLQITTTILESLEEIAKTADVPILPGIRTDATTTKASRARQFLVDFDATCKAVEDYTIAFNALHVLLGAQLDGKVAQQAI